MNTQLQNLIARAAELKAQIEVEQSAHFNATVQSAANLFANAGVPLDEAAAALLTLHSKPARPQRAKVAPKYRHRVTGATWTGRGRQPKWFAAATQRQIEHLGGDLA